MMILENPNFAMEFDPSESGMIFKQAMTGVEVRSPAPALSYIESGQSKALSLMGSGGIRVEKLHQSPLDQHRTSRCESDIDGFRVELEWAVPESSPYILWRWSIRNFHEKTITLSHASSFACANASYLSTNVRDDVFKKLPPQVLPRNQMDFIHPGVPSNLAVYLPGWQSWSYGGWLMAEETFPRSCLRLLTFPMIYDRAHNVPTARGGYRSEMFACLADTQSDTSLGVGFLSQRQSFGSVELRIANQARAIAVWTDLDQLQLDPGDRFQSDWTCLMLNSNGMDVVEDFVSLAGKINQARIPLEASVGWCSWYDYGQAISEVGIEENLKGALSVRDQTPMSVIQIDDGFQAEIGDWLEVGPGFSLGMEHMAEDIKAAGFSAGLWLAPFIGLSSSHTVRNHPDWILRNRWGFPKNTGWVWNQFGRAFDPTHPEFIDYLKQVISTVTRQWGYQYLKLDFLYAGVLPGVRYDPRVTRAQAFHAALQMIRETAGDSVTLLGCGCPIGPGIGIFDSMRIGPDVAANWKPSFPLFSPWIQREPTLPAAVNAIRNTIQRAQLHRRWWINDPDCLLIREDNSALSLGEIQSLATAIGMSGGNLMLSDRMSSIPPDRLDLFGMLIPPLPGRMGLVSVKESHEYPIVLSELNGPAGKWWLIAGFNTRDDVRHTTLDLADILPFSGKAHVFDVWQETYSQHDISKPFHFETEAHQVSLFAMRQMGLNPAWIGDKVHLSQGLIVSEWNSGRESLVVKLNPRRKCLARFWIYLPGDFHSASYNKIQVEPEMINGLLLFKLQSNEEGVLEIQWSEVIDDH